jgi:hypothetical protein
MWAGLQSIEENTGDWREILTYTKSSDQYGYWFLSLFAEQHSLMAALMIGLNG